MKKIGLLLVFAFSLTAGIFAHDKGDLMLNIEPQIGLALPKIAIGSLGFTRGTDGLGIGFDYALKGTVHYYFLDFISVNAGLGVSGYFNHRSGYEKDDDAFSKIEVTDHYSSAGAYFSIPFGFRFSVSSLAVGAGLTANIPIYSKAANWAYLKYTEDLGGGQTKSNSETTDRVTDSKFILNTYMGWYADLGFDLSGRKNRDGGFGMLFRLNSSLSDKIASTSMANMEYKKYKYFSVSLVFQAAVQLANLPIGEK